MIMLRLSFLIRMSLGIFLLLFSLQGQANNNNTTSKDYIFINNTGKPANDLHIQFDTEVDLVNPAPRSSGTYVGSKFRTSRVRTNGGRTQIHFANRGRSKAKVVGDGEEVWGRFTTEQDDLHIVSWYWTFNGDTIGVVMNGDLVKAQQSNSLVVPGSDVVTEIEIENDIYKGRKGADGSAVVNDLHLVTTRPVKSINEGLAETPFRKATTIHCECSTLGPPGRARTRALNRLPEPCKSLCADSRTDLYVVQLDSTAQRIPAGTKIPVKLRGDDTAEVLQWWFTENGYPLKFREGRYQNGDRKGEPKRDGDKGEPLKLGSGDRDSRYKPGGKMEDKGEIYNIAMLPTPTDEQAVFTVNLDLMATAQRNTGLAANALPRPDQIMEQLWSENYQDLINELGELVVLEGNLSADQILLTGGSAAIGFQFGPKWSVNLEAGMSRGKVNGDIPIIAFNSGSTAPIQAPWEASVQQYDLHVLLNYKISPYFSAGIGGFSGQQKMLSSEFELLSHKIALASDWQRKTKGFSLQMGVSLPLSPHASLLFNGRLKTFIGQDNPTYLPEVGAGIRINLPILGQ